MDAAYDLVVRNGALADGTGRPLFETDIAIKDGLIVRVGRVTGAGAEEIDARDRLVTPGFVDIHTHYDGQATWDQRMAPSSWHGVTTVVMGNCGVGFAPVRLAHHDKLIELMEGVEDIPGVALNEGLPWNWESFPEYLDALAQRRFDMDVCAQLPHDALRFFVMGERGARLEAATADDIARMRVLAEDAMRAGALGFSTSRTVNHRTSKGDFTPALRAHEDELMGIALGLCDAGQGVLQVITDFDAPDEFGMLRRLVGASGRPLSFSMAQVNRHPEAWRSLLALVDAAAHDGLAIRGQVAPRPIGVLLGLQCSANPFSILPAYHAISGEPLETRVKIMRDPDFRSRVLTEAEARKDVRTALHHLEFEGLFPLGDPPDYEPPPDRSIAALARRQSRAPADIAYDLLLEADGQNFIFAPFANYAYGNLDAVGELMRSANTVIGLGDGGAHVGLLADASFTTTLLSHWGRDRAAGRCDVSWLVKRTTRDTAASVGLLDRGVVAPGYKADLNVIDFDRLGVQRPYMAFDLPAGGKRMLQRATGYVATIKSGEVTYREGEATEALPGRLVRGAQPAPGASFGNA